MANSDRIKAHNAELRECIEIAESLPDAGTSVEVILQSKTVTPTKSVQEVAADSGFTALEKVTVEAIPDEYIVPKGTLIVGANGEHDVTEYENVSVYVPIPDGYVKPEGTLEIAENGLHDVTGYAAVNVNIESGGEPDPREGYQRVEWIESAEEATYPYIITDFFGDNSCGLEVIASFPVLQDRIPMGSRENSDATRFYCVYPLSANSIYYGFNTGTTISCQLKANTIYRLQTNFLNSRLVNVYDEVGNRKGGGSITSTMTQQSAPVSIFGYNYAATGAVSSKREFKLYGARCSRGHDVVREYIPCYRKSDGVYGVFEKFTGAFVTTPVSAFVGGSEIDW